MNPAAIFSRGRWSALTAALLLVLFAPADVHAQSRRDLANAANIQQRFEAAVARYQAAEDEDSIDAATTEIEQHMAACGNQRGCAMEPMLRKYRELLQGHRDADDEEPDSVWFDEEDRIDITADDVPPNAGADALLDERNRRFAQAVQFNPAVQAGIRRWLTDMRPQLMRSYENYQYMRHLMAPEFQRRGLPEALLFGILAKESNGVVHARSRAGALGPLQFMPATGRRFGLGMDGSGFDSRYDARLSAQAAAMYLMERFEQLDANIEMSLAAYNGGEGRALRVYRQSNGQSFWNHDVYNQFPAETRDYVPMVIAAAWIFLHPRDYGVRFPRVASRPATIVVQQPTSINELTICLGNNRGSEGFSRTLRNLNPRFSSPSMPIPVGTQLNVTTQMARLYNSYCLRGRRAELVRQLMQSDVSQAIVRIGALETANASSEVAVGVQAQSAANATAPVAPTPAAAAPTAPRANSTVRNNNSNRTARARQHTVARGETLHSIARRYGCSVNTLARANGLRAPNYTIRAGQRLSLTDCR